MNTKRTNPKGTYGYNAPPTEGRAGIKKPSIFKRVQNFLTKDQNYRKLVRSYFKNGNVYDPTGYGNIIGRRYTSGDLDIPTMIADPVISSAVNLVLETAFQINNDQSIVKTESPYPKIKEELEKFHDLINVASFIPMVAANLLYYGNLPIKLIWDEDMKFVRLEMEPNYSAVMPIVVSNQTIGFLKDGMYYFPYEYCYAQLLYYKDLGGTRNKLQLVSTISDEQTVYNEFGFAPSYLSSAVRPWKNIKIIEDALILQRMDQSNYMRLISVNVGDNVFAKSAVKLLNFYRQIFKKSRRVSFDQDGMSSSSFGNEFEVILPKTTRQDVQIHDIGGQIEIRAIKDLEIQYQRLFSSLRVNSSQIGFSQDAPSSMGDSPAIIWEQRFARTTKTLTYAVDQALKQIEFYYLRSLGYDVKKSDWGHKYVATSTLEEADKRKQMDDGATSMQNFITAMDSTGVPYDKTILVKEYLNRMFATSPIDVDKLLSPSKSTEATQDDQGDDEDFVAASYGTYSRLRHAQGSFLTSEKEHIAEKLVSLDMITSEMRTALCGAKVTEENKIIHSGRENVLTPKQSEISYQDYLSMPDTYESIRAVVDLGIESKRIQKSRYHLVESNYAVQLDMTLMSSVRTMTAAQLNKGTIAEIENAYIVEGKLYVEGEDLSNLLWLRDTGYTNVIVKNLFGKKE